MTRLLCVLVFMAALATPVFASVPSLTNSSVTFNDPLTSTCIWVCPHGDASSITVTVNDQNDVPMQNVSVAVSFFDSRVINLGSTLTKMTDLNGQAAFTLYMGTNAKDSPNAIGSEVKIVGTYASVDYTLYDGTKYVLSPDLDGADVVNDLDYAIFRLDYLKGLKAIPPGWRTDYNQDGYVTDLDYSKFRLHYLHTNP